MGQNNCRCSHESANQNQIPKCSLLHQQMLTEFEIPDKENWSAQQEMSASHSKQTASITCKYTDLLLTLRNTNQMFIDSYFQPPLERIKETPAWKRLSARDCLSEHPHPKLSKVCKILKLVFKSYPEVATAMKPLYSQTLGLAVCHLWVQGQKTEVLVDDYLPVERLCYEVEPDILILEKALAKVLGDYKYIQLFSVGELFSEVTGIPHYESQLTGGAPGSPHDHRNRVNSFSSFKDALKCDEVLFETTSFNDDMSVFGCRRNYAMSSISFSNFEHKPTLIKMVVHCLQVLSVRVVHPLPKYNDTNELTERYYSPLYFECFQELRHGRLSQYGRGFMYGNCICTYLGMADLDNIFTELEGGTYYLYLRQFTGPGRLSIIGYSAGALKFSEIFNEYYANHFLANQLEELQQTLAEEEIGNSVTAKIKTTDNRISLYFTKNYKQKTIKVLSQQCFIVLEDKGKGLRELPLSNVMGKWVFVMVAVAEEQTNEVRDHPFQIVDN